MLNKHNFEVANFVCKEESRYSLQAILVTPQATVATDGHRLVKVTVPADRKAEDFPKADPSFHASDTFAPFLLPAESAKQIAKAIPKKQTIPILECVAIDGKQTDANGTAHLAVTDLQTFTPFTVRKPEGRFPNYESIIPKTGECTLSISVNPVYLMELCKSALEFQGGRGAYNPKIILRFRDANSSIRLECKPNDERQEWLAVLMPMRDESEPEPEPEPPAPARERLALPPGPSAEDAPEVSEARNDSGKAFLLPALKVGAVRVQAASLEKAIQAYDDGDSDFEWQDDSADDPELIRPTVAVLEETDEILEEAKSLIQ
jgi:hypothetical protein